MKFSTFLNGNVEKDFLDYMKQTGETNKSGVASELIALGLRVKNNNKEKPPVSDRELLEELLLRVSLDSRITRAVYSNTRPPVSPSDEHKRNSLEKIHSHSLHNKDEVGKFLSGNYEK